MTSFVTHEKGLDQTSESFCILILLILIYPAYIILDFLSFSFTVFLLFFVKKALISKVVTLIRILASFSHAFFFIISLHLWNMNMNTDNNLTVDFCS